MCPDIYGADAITTGNSGDAPNGVLVLVTSVDKAIRLGE